MMHRVSYALCSIGMVIVPVLALAAAAETNRASDDTGRSLIMELTSSAFDAGGMIPGKHTCDGEDASPALSWSGAPQNTAGFVIIMDDPDAPPGTWIHWVLYDLPADLGGLKPGLPKTKSLENGAAHGSCWGVNSFSRVGYHGPCPPPGAPHRYYFRLYALDKRLELPPGQTKKQILQAMEGHVLAEAELMGKYGR